MSKLGQWILVFLLMNFVGIILQTIVVAARVGQKYTFGFSTYFREYLYDFENYIIMHWVIQILYWLIFVFIGINVSNEYYPLKFKKKTKKKKETEYIYLAPDLDKQSLKELNDFMSQYK